MSSGIRDSGDNPIHNTADSQAAIVEVVRSVIGIRDFMLQQAWHKNHAATAMHMSLLNRRHRISASTHSNWLKEKHLKACC